MFGKTPYRDPGTEKGAKKEPKTNKIVFLGPEGTKRFAETSYEGEFWETKGLQRL